MVSIKDIAKVVGASPSSVSIVLNGKAKTKRISDELAAKIIAVSEKMGYFPNQAAVSLRTGKSKTIGLIVENIANNFFSSLAKTIEDEVRMFGYNVVYCSTENDAEKGGDLIQMLYSQQVDGYLITPSPGMSPYIEKLLHRKKPVVLMDRFLENVDLPYVMIENYESMKNGVEQLLKAGYKKVGYVTSDLDQIQMKEREKAYHDALQASGNAMEENIVRLNFDHSKEEAVQEITAFIKNTAGLDAIVFATNYLGIYGLQSIKALGLTIPKDIGVLCFDDHDIFSLHTPAITVIEQPVQEIATTAVKILMGELGIIKPAKEAKVRLTTNLICRNSI